jgi:hypothetical protein
VNTGKEGGWGGMNGRWVLLCTGAGIRSQQYVCAGDKDDIRLQQLRFPLPISIDHRVGRCEHREKKGAGCVCVGDINR